MTIDTTESAKKASSCSESLAPGTLLTPQTSLSRISVWMFRIVGFGSYGLAMLLAIPFFPASLNGWYGMLEPLIICAIFALLGLAFATLAAYLLKEQMKFSGETSADS